MAPNPKRCRLLELPAELRLEIFEWLYQPSDFVFNLHGFAVYTSHETFNSENSATSIDLLATCHAIRSEAMPVFWKSITFTCKPTGRFTGRHITPLVNVGAFTHMRKLVLDLSSFTYLDRAAPMNALINLLALLEFSMPALQFLDIHVYECRRIRNFADQFTFDGLMDVLGRIRFQGEKTARLIWCPTLHGGAARPVDLGTFREMLRRTGSIDLSNQM